MTRTTDLADRLADVPLFARCTKGERRIVARHAEVTSIQAGQPIVRQGDMGDIFFLLLDGSATVTRDGVDTGQLQPGDFFGELALLAPTPRAATVTALTECRLGMLGDRMFKVILREIPLVAAAMLAELATRLRDAAAPRQTD